MVKKKAIIIEDHLNEEYKKVLIHLSAYLRVLKLETELCQMS